MPLFAVCKTQDGYYNRYMPAGWGSCLQLLAMIALVTV